jgi:hypothetical protein
MGGSISLRMEEGQCLQAMGQSMAFHGPTPGLPAAVQQGKELHGSTQLVAPRRAREAGCCACIIVTGHHLDETLAKAQPALASPAVVFVPHRRAAATHHALNVATGQLVLQALDTRHLDWCPNWFSFEGKMQGMSKVGGEEESVYDVSSQAASYHAREEAGRSNMSPTGSEKANDNLKRA